MFEGGGSQRGSRQQVSIHWCWGSSVATHRAVGDRAKVRYALLSVGADWDGGRGDVWGSECGIEGVSLMLPCGSVKVNSWCFMRLGSLPRAEMVFQLHKVRWRFMRLGSLPRAEMVFQLHEVRWCFMRLGSLPRVEMVFQLHEVLTGRRPKRASPQKC